MNEEHFEILKKGRDVWNKWRKENKHIKPDLSNIYLKKAYLSYADLSHANLNKAYLGNAFLRGANMSFSYLKEAFLGHSDLINANMENTHLTNANLNSANLRGAKLNDSKISNSMFWYANLGDTNFSNSRLVNADLSNVNLGKSDLSNANLNNAKLFKADLYRSNLNNAVLHNSNLIRANFIATSLIGTDFTEAYLSETVFGLTNLSSCKGLDSTVVSNKCMIDFATLQRFKDIPKSFLKKIGLPNNYIDYLPSFRERPINLYPVFLSHTWENKAFTRKLYEALIDKNVQVWFDEKKMKPGDIITEHIHRGITLYDKMILVCSREALNSWWIGEELEGIYEKERRLQKERGEKFNLLIPITIDDAIHESDSSMARFIKRKRIIGDFRQWQDKEQFNKALQQLIQALNADRKDESVQSKLGL